MENGVYSQKLRAGRRRTYFFDVRTTKSDDYYITITESKKRFEGEGYDRHKLFLYKEDFNKFLVALENTVNHVKTELMPDYDFSEFDREPEEITHGGDNQSSDAKTTFEKEQDQLDESISEVKEEVDSMIDGDLSF